MKSINYQSDFDLIVTLKTCDGTDVGFPDYDFKLFFYTTSKMNGYTASCIGGKCVNCFNDNGKIHVVFDNHKLGSGELRVDFTALLPNGLYPDGDKKLVVPQPLDIKLVRDKGECVKDIDVAILVPYVYISAYELAKSNGYTGTLEEYMQATSNMPQLVEQAENLNTFVNEWANGKRQVIEALKKWGVEADVEDSFEELAQKILDLPVKGENEEGVISHAMNGTWDLLNELNNHQRKDYPYCWGVLLDDSYKTVELSGADAYYTSDGHFQEGNGSHTFEENPMKIGRYIIYYYRNPEYYVTPVFTVNQKVICLNGKPKFNIPSNINIASLESMAKEPYDIGEGQFIISNTNIKIIDLGGIRKIGPNNSIKNSNNVISLSLPQLEEWEGDPLLQNMGLQYLSLPNLLKSSNYLVNSTDKLLYVSLPSLKEVSGSNYALITNASKIKSLELPSLETINGGTIVNSCAALTSLELPSLETLSGGKIANSCSGLTSIKLPSLETISGGTLFETCNSLSDVDLPALYTISGGTLFYNCGGIKEVKLEPLNSFLAGTIANSCTNFEKAIFPNLVQCFNSNDNYMFNTVGNLKQIDFPKLKKCSTWGTQGAILRGGLNGDLIINFPLLQETVNSMNNRTNLRICSAGPSSNVITINLGAPQDGYITLTGDSYSIKSVTILPGFRSYLNISNFTALTKECLEAIITNLGDNSDYETLQIVFGATNLAKISDEKKLEATNKNYTLS